MANEIINGMGFHHVALRASDFDRSVWFYKKLGMKPVVEWGEGDNRIAMLDIGDGSRFEIFASKGREYAAEGRFQHFAFKVDNVEESYRLALSIGARDHTPPTIMPLDSRPERMSIKVAFVTGPDGEVIEFFKQIV